MLRAESIAVFLVLVSRLYAEDNSNGIEHLISRFKYKLCAQLEQLLKFKDNPDFKERGFSEDGPYYLWIARLEALNASIQRLGQNVPRDLRDAPRDLFNLGLEYLSKRSKTAAIRLELLEIKETIGYAGYLAIQQRDGALLALEEARVCKDATGQFKVTATLVKRSEATVTLEKEAGVRIEVPVDRLSTHDRNLLKRAFGRGVPKSE